MLAAILAGNTAYAYLLKVQTDKQALSVAVMERMDRDGLATVDEMTGATFGFLGWKLFDWFVAHEGRTYGELADFMGYVRRDRIVIETGLPWRKGFKAELPSGALPLDSGSCRIGFARVPLPGGRFAWSGIGNTHHGPAHDPGHHGLPSAPISAE